MNRQISSVAAFVVSVTSTLVPRAASAQNAPQDAKENPRTQDREPPSRELFVPYVPPADLTREKQLENAQQVLILAEMNRITVELVKRRSNRYLIHADTPQLVKRLKDLARKLHDVP